MKMKRSNHSSSRWSALKALDPSQQLEIQPACSAIYIYIFKQKRKLEKANEVSWPAAFSLQPSAARVPRPSSTEWPQVKHPHVKLTQISHKLLTINWGECPNLSACSNFCLYIGWNMWKHNIYNTHIQNSAFAFGDGWITASSACVQETIAIDPDKWKHSNQTCREGAAVGCALGPALMFSRFDSNLDPQSKTWDADGKLALLLLSVGTGPALCRAGALTT